MLLGDKQRFVKMAQGGAQSAAQSAPCTVVAWSCSYRQAKLSRSGFPMDRGLLESLTRISSVAPIGASVELCEAGLGTQHSKPQNAKVTQGLQTHVLWPRFAPGC